MTDRTTPLWRRPIVWLGVLVCLTAGGACLLRPEWFSPPAVRVADANSGDIQGLACVGLVDDEFGMTALLPLQPGQVEQVCVREGDVVCGGKVLLTLHSRGAQLRTAEARAAVKIAEVQLKECRDRPRQLRGQIAQQKDAVAAALSRLEAARKVFAGRQKLEQFKLESGEQVEAAREQVKEIEAMYRMEVGKENELLETNLHLAEERASAELEAATARLAQAEQVEAEHRLLAPTSGTILRISVTAGDTITPTSPPSILFRSSGQMIVRASIDQEHAHRLRVGMTAVVRDPNRTTLVWNGRVTRIAPWFTQRRTPQNTTMTRTDDLTLECIITLEPSSVQPLPHQSVRVWIDPRNE